MDINPPRRDSSEKLEELLDRLLDRPGGDSSAHSEDRTWPRGSNCPDDSLWRDLMAHRMSAEESQLLIEHAAGCRRCGAILNFWAGILAEEVTPTETLTLSRLESQQAGWQERMTATLTAQVSGSGTVVSGGRNIWPAVMAIAGLVAAAAIIFVAAGVLKQQRSPEQLLAEAYTGHRIMDARIPLAGYASVDPGRYSRAAGTSGMSDSVPLLEARAAITQALMKKPEDPYWLRLQARSDLLNESYESAIDTLNRLHTGDPDNVDVLVDLASAYIMRSQKTSTPTDEATALDYLEQAVRLAPANTVALYNEALVLQDLFQYSTAIDVWKRFLATEHDKAWLSDANRHLNEIEAIEARVKRQQSLLEPALASPESMLHLARSPALVADYDEELSTLYLPQLLKSAYPLPADSPATHLTECSDTCQAGRVLLHAIAASLETHHGDHWLADMLAGSSAPNFSKGVNVLASAIADGPHANPGYALAEARNAETDFEQSGNIAGVARAATEEVYNLEHLRELRDCLNIAGHLSSLLAGRQYPWIDAQFHADQWACERMRDGLSSSRNGLQHSIDVSSRAGYQIIHLRAHVFLAFEEQEFGNNNRALAMLLRDLGNYWKGNYPLFLAVDLYSSMGDEEVASSRFHTAIILHLESLHQSELLRNADMVVQIRLELIHLEIAAGEMQDSSNEIELAKSELSTLPGDVNQDKRAGFQISLAESYLLRAQAYLARNDLRAAEQVLQNKAAGGYEAEDRDLHLHRASAEGRLALLEGRNKEAEDALTHAIGIAERGYKETASVQDRMNWIETAQDVYAALALTWYHEGKDPLDILALWERYRLLSSGSSLQQWCRDESLDCLAKHLREVQAGMNQETVVGTIRADRLVLLWTLDDRGIQMREIHVDPDRFDLLCHTFFEALATPSSSEASIHSYGSRLSEMLLAPFDDRLDSHRTLIFDLDDSMEFLPISALSFRGNYLGLQVPISSVHSLLLATRPKPEGHSSKSVVIGSSDPGDPDVPRLPEARTEAEEVAGILVSPKVYVGEDALASTIETVSPHAALIHFAGHTSYVDGGTRLLLAQPRKDGPDWIDARTFRSRDFADCRLVVLSACSTGKREERSSDGIQDIVQALTAEGAQQVVATHWDVDSAVSVQLMKSFYAGLANGLTVPQALLQAKSAVSANAEYRHPYFWAPYYVIGMSKSNLEELFHHERSWNDSARYHSTTGLPSRKPI